MSETPSEDPVLGRLTESRVGKGDTTSELAAWGGKPAAPVPGAAWYGGFAFEPARLSNGLATDRQWATFDFTSVLLRGFCDLDIVREALADDGVFPVGAVPAGDTKPRAMATIWLNVIHDSVCGRYHEVVLSFDVSLTQPDAVAFREGGLVAAPWALQYANFGPSVCDGQLLHSLWIDSPLSITWGREMQAFPKHPKPVKSTLTDDASAFAFDLSWDGRNVMRGRLAKRFGLAGFVRQGVGLVTANNPVGVTRFLASRAFDIPIVMPAKTAAQNGVPRRYVGHLWKGLDPFAVQVWRWSEGDTLELGDIEIPTGCEDHNGHALLARAGFQPVSVTYIAHAGAVVEAVRA